MQQYDATLKKVLQRVSDRMLRQLTGFSVSRWHNVEISETRTLRLDLLGETPDQRLVHIELQSTNDPDMALRMAEYALAVYNSFRRLPTQLVLYVGHAPLAMNGRLEGRHLSFQCRVVDIKNMDGEAWLASDHVEDAVVAILMSFANQRRAIKTILQRIAGSDPAKRPEALAELLVLAGLRKTGDIIRNEARQMPILNNIMDHEVFGPILREGIELGRSEGEKRVILNQLSERFGHLPDWVKDRIERMPVAEIDRLAVRLLNAASLQDLLR